MIEEYYPNPDIGRWKNKKSHSLPVKWTASTDSSYELRVISDAARKGCTVEEWKRRDAIVRDHFQKCQLYAGDWVWPHSKEGVEEYGHCKVIGISRDYFDFEHDKVWPENDNPFIVIAASDKQKAHFHATYSYLVKEKPND